MIVKKFEEYALALPISQVATVAEAIEQNGSWSMPYIGLVMKSPDEDLHDDIIEAKRYLLEGTNTAAVDISAKSRAWLPDGYGVWIQSVNPKSPAEKSGLREGDIIVRLNGKHVKTHYQVFENLSVMAGEVVEFEILRNGRFFCIQVNKSHNDDGVLDLSDLWMSCCRSTQIELKPHRNDISLWFDLEQIRIEVINVIKNAIGPKHYKKLIKSS